MAIGSRVTQKDLQIARRLAWLRSAFLCSREDLAKLAKVKRGAITRVELGRVPLHYGLARYLLAQLQVEDFTPINPMWLADGVGSTHLNWPFLLPSPLSIGVSPKLRFSDFVNENRPLLKSLTKQGPEAELPESWLADYIFHWRTLRSRASRQLTGLTILELVVGYSAERLAGTSDQAAQRFHEFKVLRDLWGKDLTLTSNFRNSGDVKLTLKGLLDKVRKLTEPTGMKARLAEELKVPQSRVSEWLSGKHDPSGEVTLQLLHWVQQQERSK